MKNLSLLAKVYILGIILIGLGLIAWMVMTLDWAKVGIYLLAALGGVAQTLKVEGPNNRTNYSFAWFVYGFTLILLGPVPALFVVVVSHLAEWIRYRYSWYIQSFNIGAHALPVFLGGLVFGVFNREPQVIGSAHAIGTAVASLVFVLVNHLLVGLVVRLARGQSFGESGVFGFLTLFLDFTVLAMGAVTAVVWQSSPFAALLNILPLYLLYNAMRVPRLMRQLQEMRVAEARVGLNASGD